MISTAALEESVLSLLCFSTEHSSLLALKLTSSTLFTNRPNQRIAQEALQYVQKYQTPPKQALEILLEADIRRGEEGKLIKRQLEIFEKQASQIDAAFILESLDNFIETQKLTNALQNSLELLQQGELTQAKETIYKASSIPISSDGTSGLWMKDSKQALRFLEKDQHIDFFSSGVDLLDLRGVRPDRKTLFFTVAATGKGKTWQLVEVGKRALQHHHSLLHITLELSADKTAKRYMQAIFSLTKDEVEQITVPFFENDAQGRATLQFRELERDSVFAKKDYIKARLEEWWSCPTWMIQEFPTSSLSVEQLSMYLDSLERERGFKPDILVIDYADLMKIDSASLRIDTGRLYKELRGMSVRRDMAMVTATQGNRESADAKLVRSTNVAEDWSKIGTADIVLTYSQTPEEKKLGLARIYVAKSRESGDCFTVMISQAYNCGQFCLDSKIMNLDLVNAIQNVNS